MVRHLQSTHKLKQTDELPSTPAPQHILLYRRGDGYYFMDSAGNGHSVSRLIEAYERLKQLEPDNALFKDG